MFNTTQWTAVLAAKEGDTRGRAALSELCVRYREPIRRFIERTIKADQPGRYGGRDSEDLSHDFLGQLLAEAMFKNLERGEGKFRTYLLGAVKHFLSVIRKREMAEKRGGNVQHVPLNEELLATAALPNDAVFDRDWAEATIDRAVGELGDSPETTALLPWLSQELTAVDRANLAGRLGMSENAVKVALHRLRKKFRETVRAYIAQTLTAESEIEAELAYLIAAIRG